MKQVSWILLGAVLASFAVTGCDPQGGDVSAQLKPLRNCFEVESAIRVAALQEMNRRLDDALESALQWAGSDCRWGGEYEDSAGAPAPSAGGAWTNSSSDGGAKQASGTNNQVAGVEEADFVKNDNKHIFIVSGEHFRIIEAWPAQTAHEIAKVSIEGQVRKLFVTKQHALIYSSLTPDTSKTSGDDYYGGYQECTYGYSCSFTGDGKPTLITVLDISDLAAPKKVREIRLSGSYVNARQIGSAVFTVVSSPAMSFPGLRYYPDGVYGCGTELSYFQIVAAFEELRAQNAKIIHETPLNDWLPSVEDNIVAGPNAGTTSNLLLGCEGFYRSSIGDGEQFTTVLSVDMDAAKPAQVSTIVSRPGAVYASAKALYISVPHEKRSGMGWYPSMSNQREASTVHKFSLDAPEAQAAYAASGVVKGRVLNQFSMDEHEGYFRIATSNGRVPSPDVHSTLTVLQQVGTQLMEVGKVDDLAPKEDIRSVRFSGDRGFIVTFKKTDPLFVIDLARPAYPRVLAELKIPGFSTYMHMMDETHLLTIGYDADDQGSFAWFTGVMLQIFDVSDPQNPLLAHKEIIGTRGSSSAALNNHLAFNYFAPKNLLALPMTVCEGSSGGGSYGTTMTFSGLMVYDVTAGAGFNLRGKVAHPTGSNISCSNWWTNAESQVERSIIMDDYVFSVSRELIKVNSLNDLATDLVSLGIDT